MPSVPALALLVFVPLQAARESVGARPRPSQPARSAELSRPAPVTLAGTLLDERGVPLARWTVGVQTEGVNLGRPEPLQATTGPSGRFYFHEELGPRFALVLRSPDGGEVAIRENFVLDGRALLLRLEPGERVTGFLAGELTGVAGEELPGASLCAWRADGPGLRAEVRRGRFLAGPLPPGEHVLVAAAEGLPALALTVVVEAHATHDLGRIPLAPPGWVRVSVTHPGIELGERDLVATELFRDGRHRSGAVRNGPMAEKEATGLCGLGLAHPREPLPPRGLSRPLAPGFYLLRTRSWDWLAPDVWVEVRSGETSEVVLTVVPATDQAVVLRLPAGDPSIRVRLTVTSRDGTFRHEDWLYLYENQFFGDVQGLLPGVYHLEARSGSGRTLATDFEVLDLGASQVLQLDF